MGSDSQNPTPGILTNAVIDMLAAYNDAKSRVADFTDETTGELGGRTFLPGVHKFTGGVTISDTVILSGTCADVFIFQIS